MQSSSHISVLLSEACAALLPARNGALLVDGTFGRGGHSRELLRQMPADARLIALDRDHQAESAAREIVDPRFSFVRTHFGAIHTALDNVGVTRIDGLLLDIGISSPQVDEGERGFSFMRDGPLDMRMDQSRGVTAHQWLAEASSTQIASVIHDYGEERFATRIATAIVAARQREPIERTLQLAQIIEKAVPTRGHKQHPATKSFQAIRIHINRELEELGMALSASLDLLSPGGRLAVITFHSLEDRIVKLWMRDQSGRTPIDPRLRHLPTEQLGLPTPKLRMVGSDVAPSDVEISANPRARSARLRVAERLQ
ncbi:MAG: 16S rRNA (cytosine(1402)-N(4))-methyltransferase RsmH [Betaproteobacteria bacterium]|nr:MAG: 16S rRNA (cytosine(1402)-N(4))-methyltransferase RsmH [Betaproteobacteria bacterium]